MIKNWNDFDETLKEIALIDIAVTEAGRARDLAMISAETRYKDATATRLATREILAKQLEKFYRVNRREVERTGKRSKDLHFGRVGIRAKAASLKLLKGFKWADVLEALKSSGFPNWSQYIQTKESVKKEVLKSAGHTAEELASVGVQLKGGEEFFIETYPERAAEAA